MQGKQNFYEVYCKMPILAETEDEAVLTMFKWLAEGKLEKKNDFGARRPEKEDDNIIPVKHWG